MALTGFVQVTKEFHVDAWSFHPGDIGYIIPAPSELGQSSGLHIVWVCVREDHGGHAPDSLHSRPLNLRTYNHLANGGRGWNVYGVNFEEHLVEIPSDNPEIIRALLAQ